MGAGAADRAVSPTPPPPPLTLSRVLAIVCVCARTHAHACMVLLANMSRQSIPIFNCGVSFFVVQPNTKAGDQNTEQEVYLFGKK